MSCVSIENEPSHEYWNCAHCCSETLQTNVGKTFKICMVICSPKILYITMTCIHKHSYLYACSYI